MKPVEFMEQNKTLTKPKNMTDKECGSLHVYVGNEMIVSCWKMTILERLKFLFVGKVWFSTIAYETHPPIKLSIETPFKKQNVGHIEPGHPWPKSNDD